MHLQYWRCNILGTGGKKDPDPVPRLNWITNSGGRINGQQMHRALGVRTSASWASMSGVVVAVTTLVDGSRYASKRSCKLQTSDADVQGPLRRLTVLPGMTATVGATTRRRGTKKDTGQQATCAIGNVSGFVPAETPRVRICLACSPAALATRRENFSLRVSPWEAPVRSRLRAIPLAWAFLRVSTGVGFHSHRENERHLDICWIPK
jgi:hypothetical protein